MPVMRFSDIGNLHGLDAGICGCDTTDGAIGIERQAVDAHFTMRARPVVEVVGIDAMVDNIPVAYAGDVHNGIMSRAIDPEHTIFAIITDGYENASRRYDYPSVKQMIEQQKELGWEFLFLGANIDAVGEAAKMGIGKERAVTYLADERGQSIAYDAIGDATCAMRFNAPDSAPIDGTWKSAVEADTAKRGGKKHRFFNR